MLITYFLVTLGVFIFLFLFWKRLKEDYPSGQIFNTASFILGGILLAKIITNQFFPLWWFWGSFLGVVIGLTLGSLSYKLRIFEVLEAVVFGTFPFLSLVFLSNSITTSSTSSFIAFLIMILLVALFLFLDSRYKRFAWYKSGRVGFSGLSALGLFFIIRAIVAISFSGVLSLVGRIDAFFSSIVAFLVFLTVFNLSRQKS